MFSIIEGQKIVTTWANRPDVATLSPYIDRVIFTDVGVGGSEWYSDGTRWRAVGGQVVLKEYKSTDTPPLNIALSAAAFINLDSIQIPLNLVQIGDAIEVNATIDIAGTTVVNTQLSLAYNNTEFTRGASVSASKIVAFGSPIATNAIRKSNPIMSVVFGYYLDNTGTVTVKTIGSTYSTQTSASQNAGGGLFYYPITATNGGTTTNPLAVAPSSGFYLGVNAFIVAGGSAVVATASKLTITLKTCG